MYLPPLKLLCALVLQEEEKIRWRQKWKKPEGRRRGVRSRESVIHHEQAKRWPEVTSLISPQHRRSAPDSEICICNVK